MTYQEKLDKAKPVIDALLACGDGNIFVDLQEAKVNGVRISYFPPESCGREAIRAAMSFVGKMEKEEDRTMRGEKDGVMIILFSAMECKIVGYKKVQEPVMVESGYREVQKPIYECRAFAESEVT